MTDFTITRGRTFRRTFALVGTDEDGIAWAAAHFDEITFCIRTTPAPDAVNSDTTVADGGDVLLKVTLSGDNTFPDDAGEITFAVDGVTGTLRIEASAIATLPTKRKLHWDLVGRADDDSSEDRIVELARGGFNVSQPVTTEP